MGEMAVEAQVSGVPHLTDEQRREALAKAVGARRERADALGAIKRGEARPEEFLARTDSVALRTRVELFVESWPRYGRKKAQRLMRELGIAGNRRIGGLGKRQYQGLMDRILQIRDGE